MADVCHQKKEGSAVYDRMGYVHVPTPIAGRSVNLVMSIKASNGSLFNSDGSLPCFSYEWGIYYLDISPQSIIKLSYSVWIGESMHWKQSSDGETQQFLQGLSEYGCMAWNIEQSW